ncbi:hypothetical protein J2S98_003988 [Arthrobacter oryzae]|uniref:hypothetical protein n=1 Tax=Arthrobacter TaxID=1663 RepID=UPI001F328DDF|nr:MULTISPECIES: hypothetical protein [Arthrobacter]MDP9988799.1 hypothetical protein [Arthrobacter oryzae]UKA71421.1 hypothetical protein LFT49_01330 [Arthrobacter sp. FW306-06-A]
MNLRSIPGTALAVVVVLSLGMGSASAAEHGKILPPATPAHTAAPAVHRPGGSDLDVLTGYPKEVHTDERLIEEELEFGEAAPHTHRRFHAGTA